ncbi:hypothetical protein BJ322DRAFT_1082254 [Thelephora terrestris]|uniref:F-box domain-containing protein n=1 Tax=Thelephora terrestris TaxID=56493 RepID=A0A9P6H750_9AGAM|nr:hypothetical protein BJ322DRAFT_1082254 [Thelephora terrestris]
MLPPLPPEIFDLIVDNLHDEPIALKACCLVSKSWVPRARRNLFALVTFSSLRWPVRSWMNAFPNPSNSPAHHTRDLHFYDRSSVIAASTPNWVRHFRHTEELRIANIAVDGSTAISFVRLQGLSPALKFLNLRSVSASLSEILNLICSFPLLDHLWLHFVTTWGDADECDIPSTSPRLTGSLNLLSRTRPILRGLLNLPNGLHFAQITACHVEYSESLVDLISRCSDTLESLTVGFDSPMPGPLVLSEATKLQDVKFECTGLSVRWIIATLRTAKSTNLRKITITVASSATLVDPIGETVYREWQDLDHLLDQLWTSRLICPSVVYDENRVTSGLGGLVLSLLPRLASKGVVNGLGGYCQRSEW